MVPRTALWRPGLLISVLASAIAACGSPTGPGPIPVNPPQITCGPPISITGVIGVSQTVNYMPPTVTGGANPVSVSCSPAAGSSFPLGATTVTCTATDSQSRAASCSFLVTLTHRELAVTRFLAFGDSLTEGENGRPFVSFLDLQNRYTTVLQRFFDERIPGQQITVLNAGVSGESVVAASTDRRLKEEIARHQPQVLLLLHGINDINGGMSSDAVARALRDHVRTARDRGVQFVFVSTLLPTSPEACNSPTQRDPRCRALDTPPGQPADVNQHVRSLVPPAGASLVDPYEEFMANRTTYYDTDGLHLSPAGNRALATAFWNRIVEVIPAPQLFGE